ncbi:MULTISPECIES: YczE/YyaS/YitT family protein [Bacillaceae]|uniref:Membrane protein n=1 Tax=Oceanobacillus caeni TaxID=405946 RepID=A0ABR5MHK7_9BACI|nr:MULTISPECIES: YitT family protein [Bacillaceae]KPH73468.1 membrane protein [Oceanobacillus caeni]MED4476340.1 YitT family protein [Oceanobacillus caeni]
MKKGTSIQWLFFFVGLMVMGIGVALTVKGQRFGVGSWDVLHIGLFKNFGLSIGLWSIIMGVIIITISSIGLHEFPKIGTFMNMIFVGLFIDFFNWVIPNPHTFSMQFVDFILGIVLLAIGAGIYISANLGAGPRDSLMLLIVGKFGCSIMVARTVMEVIVAIVGFLLGGPFGIGTVIMAFALGPIIQVSLGYSQRLLDKCLSDKHHAHVAAH